MRNRLSSRIALVRSGEAKEEEELWRSRLVEASWLKRLTRKTGDPRRAGPLQYVGDLGFGGAAGAQRDPEKAKCYHFLDHLGIASAHLLGVSIEVKQCILECLREPYDERVHRQPYS